ncbi:MAG: histidine kinase [Gammaproteobacteria bacterium]|nr:histidine kinase [Gammaproteobacteria bacterium]
MSSNPEQISKQELFLPDFCAIPVVFVIVLVAELLAFVLAIAPISGQQFQWEDLGLISLFIQWIALTGTAVLCIMRKWLCRFSDKMAGLLSYALLILVTLILSEAAFWLARYTGVFAVLSDNWHLDFLIRNMAISMIVSAIALRYLYIQHQWKLKIQSESRARLDALQARIRPHFLFNSMNVIASLTRDKPALAEEAIEDLSDLFRVTLKEDSGQTTLQEEFDLGKRYLRLEKLRLGDRLNIEWNTANVPVDIKIPSLTIQPLLENAIYHGIETLPEGGTIRVNASTRDDTLMLEISNPLNTSQSNKINNKGNEIAVANVRERLQVFYKGRADLDVEDKGQTYVVILHIPTTSS